MGLAFQFATLGLVVQFFALFHYTEAIIEKRHGDQNYKDSFEKSFGLFIASVIPYGVVYVLLVLSLP